MKKYEFEYLDDKIVKLSKMINIIMDDKACYTDWYTREKRKLAFWGI